VIVRILGEGQYELDETEAAQLAPLDLELDAAVDRDDEAAFRTALDVAVRLVRSTGTPLRPDELAASDLILPSLDASVDEVRQLLAEAEAIPVVAAREEPPGNAVFAVDVLACLVYAIKTMIEPEPALWSGYCVQRAYDCLFFADEALARSGGPAGLMQALDAWLDGDAGDQLRRESVSFAVLPAQLRQLSDRG